MSKPNIAPGSAAPTSSQPRTFSNREAEENWSREATTLTGLELWITPAKADDRGPLEQFFDKVTPQDLYYRFLSGIHKVDDERITAMVRDDDDSSIDFLALDNKTGDILATAMLVADPAFENAEFAMCTREDAKNKGISWVLLDHATRYAEAMGIKRLTSLQSASDVGALQLEREMGFTVRTSAEDPTHMLAEKMFGPHGRNA
ncbi:GNAT family N-acetyltransferase [Altererythrobacter sp. ZODW24]|uniref:GNAT family N-acetyltransferase n=1 Tax=Altererythrobacter sp. ZODW24 TaxID=2185142 RepID=UPI0013B4190E|nr:GNAT family N-acetyltransferase [Altererythrobacter sp. ZODW24]